MKSKLTLFLLFFVVRVLSQSSSERGVVPTTNGNQATINNGAVYAIIVGVSNYKFITPLSFADKDALLFSSFLQSKAGGNLSTDNILLLVNDQVTASTQPTIRHWINDVKKPKKGDRVYFYFAGHGDAIDADEYFFLLQDCNPAGDKNNYIGGMASVLQMYNLKSYIKNQLTANGVEVIMIWDACRTDELPGGKNGLLAMQQGITEKNNGELMMLSASAGEKALESSNYAQGHGLFTYYLIDGLSGAADKQDEGGNGNGIVDINELESWVKIKVRKDASNKFNNTQNPKFIYNKDYQISVTDANFSKAWSLQKQGLLSATTPLDNTSRAIGSAIDTALSNLYNSLMQHISQTKENDFSTAEKILKKIEQAYPQDPLSKEAAFNLAMAYINRTQYKINIYMSGKDDIYGLAYYKTSPFYDEIKNIIESTNLENAGYLSKAIKILQKTKNPDKEYLKLLNAREKFFIARAAYWKEKNAITVDKAIELVHSNISIEANAANNFHLLSVLYVQKTNFNAALAYEKTAVKLAPDWPYALTGLGYIYRKLDFSDSAIAILRKANTLSPYDVDTYNNLGLAFKEIGNIDSAIFYLRETIKIDPECYYPYKTLAEIYKDQGKTALSKDYYEQYEKIKANNSTAAFDDVRPIQGTTVIKPIPQNINRSFYGDAPIQPTETRKRNNTIIK